MSAITPLRVFELKAEFRRQTETRRLRDDVQKKMRDLDRRGRSVAAEVRYNSGEPDGLATVPHHAEVPAS